MKYLLILLFPFAANSQVIADISYFGTAPNWIKVVSYRNASTSIVVTQSRLNDSMAAVRTTVNTKLSTSTANATYQPIGSYSLTTHNHNGVYALTTDNLTGVTVLSSGTQTITINKSLYTVTPSAAMTINATGGTAGQRFTIVVTTSGTSSFVITFGTGFKTISTLATGTVTAKKFAVSFINLDGVTNMETGRTTGQ